MDHKEFRSQMRGTAVDLLVKSRMAERDMKHARTAKRRRDEHEYDGMRYAYKSAARSIADVLADLDGVAMHNRDSYFGEFEREAALAYAGLTKVVL